MTKDLTKILNEWEETAETAPFFNVDTFLGDKYDHMKFAPIAENWLNLEQWGAEVKKSNGANLKAREEVAKIFLQNKDAQKNWNDIEAQKSAALAEDKYKFAVARYMEKNTAVALDRLNEQGYMALVTRYMPMFEVPGNERHNGLVKIIKKSKKLDSVAKGGAEEIVKYVMNKVKSKKISDEDKAYLRYLVGNEPEMRRIFQSEMGIINGTLNAALGTEDGKVDVQLIREFVDETLSEAKRQYAEEAKGLNSSDPKIKALAESRTKSFYKDNLVPIYSAIARALQPQESERYNKDYRASNPTQSYADTRDKELSDRGMKTP